jgi:uncharacterized circularly permuted ATP-grasp superfamily protein
MNADAIARYHDILQTGSLAADSQAKLDELQEQRGLAFGTRPLCTVLRPRFLGPNQYRFLQDRVKVLLPAFQTVYDRAMADPGFRKQLGLREWEESLLEIEPGFRNPSPTSRFDSFFVSESDLKFTEFNAETPAGAGFTDALADVFYGLPAFQEFQREYNVIAAPCKPGVTHALTDAYAQWKGSRTEPPRIAILDWREVPTFCEFVLFYDYFRSMGIEARNVDPRDVEYRDGKLMAGDYHITLIYKRVLLSELIERGGLDHPVVRAVRDGAVCMANSFRCKILCKKAAFAVLSDEANAGLFTKDQLAAIANHIPWTRVVAERKSTIDGQPIDLIPYMLANKERFVLKPNDDYGGKGIVLGWTVDAPIWEQAVKAALTEPYIVQQRVNLPYEPFPSMEQGRLQFIPRMLDTNPFVAFGTHMHGCLTRISTEALLNVTAGGGSTVPTFLMEKR